MVVNGLIFLVWNFHLFQFNHYDKRNMLAGYIIILKTIVAVRIKIPFILSSINETNVWSQTKEAYRMRTYIHEEMLELKLTEYFDFFPVGNDSAKKKQKLKFGLRFTESNLARLVNV